MKLHFELTEHQRKFLTYVRTHALSDTNYMRLGTLDNILNKNFYHENHKDMLNNIGKHWTNRWEKHQLYRK